MKSTFMMKAIQLLTLSLIIFSSACTKKNDATNTPTSANPAAVTKGPNCPNGAAPKMLEGECNGVWKLAKNAQGAEQCVFSWGPMISCPEKSKPLANPNVCYGDTVKEGKGIKTETDCQKQYGQKPTGSDPHYTLACCED